MSILATIGVGIVKQLGGDVIGGYFKTKQAEIAAMNDQDRLAAELAAKTLLAENDARRIEIELLKAEQGSFITRIIRPLLALPFIIFTFKVVVYDKVLGLGTTDPLDPNMWGVFLTVVAAYFGGRTVERTASIVTAVFRDRKK